MKHSPVLVAVLWLAVLLLDVVPVTAQVKSPRPNVVLIMVDDMGYSDLGCYGGEIETPNVDRLAANGLRFTRFYNTGRCWPTRASLLTGFYPHQVGHAMTYGEKAPPGYRGTSRERALMIPEILRPVGYRSYHVGKWHLNNRKPGPNATWPLGRGFDRSYFMATQNNYFNPRRLYEEEGLVERPGENGGYYSTEALSARAVRYLKEHAAEHADGPFFLYLAYTAPHFPLHALPEDIARYRGKYLQGWDAVRRARRERQKKMGLLDCDLSPRDPDARPWDALTKDEKQTWDTRMALHAAMIHRIDRGVGQVIGQLREMSALESTLILFLSDNGASAEYLVRGDGHDPQAPPGSAATYLCLEVGWSNACNTPFRFHKMWMHEGGISTPLIAHWPRGIEARGKLSREVGHVIDIVPTIEELAGVEPAVTKRDQPIRPGRSLAPVLRGGIREPHPFLFWEHVGNRALRKGDWKLVAEHEKPWELYNLRNDRSELEDLASRRPEKVKKMRARWQSFADEIGVVEWSTFPQSRRKPAGHYRRK